MWDTNPPPGGCGSGGAKPPTPAISTPACIPSRYDGSGITISWTTANPAVSNVDISAYETFSPGFFNKKVTGTSAAAPGGFSYFEPPLAPLTLNPNITYYVRLWNNYQYSDNATFFIPACTIIGPWIQAVGDVHANDRIRASGGPNPLSGVACPAQALTPRVKDGLISGRELSDNFGNSDRLCAVGNRAQFAPYMIPTYDDLKSIYFDQSKAAKATLSSDQTGGIDLTGANDKLYYITGSLALDNPADITGSRTGIVFVDGQLDIGPIPGNKLDYGNNNSGLVFVVKGNVNIDKSVTRIDAVIISGGTIYTAGENCSSSSPETAGQLVINGSLISLNDAKNIKFCRTIAENPSTPAEQVILQPKYLVILRNLFSKTFHKWSEIE